jgi:hypothetical protein
MRMYFQNRVPNMDKSQLSQTKFNIFVHKTTLPMKVFQLTTLWQSQLNDNNR